MIDAGDARGADCLPVDRADRARGVRPGAEIVVDDVDRRSPGALPYLGELRTGVVEDVIDDLHARIRREIGVRIAVAIVRAQILHEAEALRPARIACKQRAFIVPGDSLGEYRPSHGDQIVLALSVDILVQ